MGWTLAEKATQLPGWEYSSLQDNRKERAPQRVWPGALEKVAWGVTPRVTQRF